MVSMLYHLKYCQYVFCVRLSKLKGNQCSDQGLLGFMGTSFLGSLADSHVPEQSVCLIPKYHFTMSPVCMRDE